MCIWVCSAIGGHVATVAAATPPRVERRPYMPMMTVARGWAGFEALGSPAALGSVDGFSAGAMASGGGGSIDGDRGAGWGVSVAGGIAGIALGLGLDRANFGAATKANGHQVAAQSYAGVSRLSLALGARLAQLLRAGVAVRSLLDVNDGVLSVDLSLVADPWPWLSLGVSLADALAATRYLAKAPGGRGGPELQAGLVLGRPHGAWAAALEVGWPDGAKITLVKGSALVEIAEGLDIGTEVVAQRPSAAIGEGDLRVALFGRWRQGGITATPATWSHAPRDRPVRFGAGIAASWQGHPKGGTLATLLDLDRRARAGDVDPGLVAAARRQRAGLAVTVVPEAEATAIARFVLELSAALAASDGAAVCARIAEGGARLDVESVDPPLSVHQRLGRAAICAQLSSKEGPWWTYVHELGPAEMHAEMPRTISSLFRIHGGAFAELPRAQSLAYAELLARDHPSLRCRSYGARFYEGLGGAPAIEVAVGCTGVAAMVWQVLPEQGGYRIGKLAIELRVQKRSP